MNRAKRTPARLDQPRPSEPLTRMRENLDLEDKEWNVFLRLARAGFVDYEKANSIDPDLGLRLQDVPDSWWEEPEPLGYVFRRVAQRADAELGAGRQRFRSSADRRQLERAAARNPDSAPEDGAASGLGPPGHAAPEIAGRPITPGLLRPSRRANLLALRALASNQIKNEDRQS